MSDGRPTFLSLFAGIGGIDLGLERAGWRCVGQVEIDPFCRRVLAKHWPDVPKWEDVRTVNRETLAGLEINLIAGGFPCQDISSAGHRAGIRGKRSGLWAEYLRLIREIRPGFVFVENVAALAARGLGVILGDLAACGYDAEWECLPAASFGAPHPRDRIWIIAYPESRGSKPELTAGNHEQQGAPLGLQRLGAGAGDGSFGRHPAPRASIGRRTSAALAQVVPVPERPTRREAARIHDSRAQRDDLARSLPDGSLGGVGPWFHGPVPQPLIPRMDDGVPFRLDRSRALGNAVVPQVAEWIGRLLLAAQNIEFAKDLS